MSFYAPDAAAAAADHPPQPQPPTDWNSFANFVFNASPAAARPPPPPHHHFSPANAAANPLLLHARAQPHAHAPQLSVQPTVHHPANVARSLATIAGTNAKLPPEAFELAENYRPSQGDLLSRSKNVLVVRKPAPHVAILLKFNQQLQFATPTHSLIKFWKPLFAAHFAARAVFHFDLKSATTHNTRPFKLPVELMATLWKAKYNSGLTSERILLDSPIEHAYSDDSVVVDCPNTLIISNYPRTVVLTDGHLRVCFNSSHKIFRWEFSARDHQELFTANAFNPSGAPYAHCSEYGIPRNLLDQMLIAESIHKLNDKIDAEVSQIVSQASNNPASLVPNGITTPIASNPVVSVAANVPANTPSASHLNQSALATEITNNEQSTGNAYRALLSQLGGSQALPLDQALSAKQGQMPSPSSLTPNNNRTDAARTLLGPSISADEVTVNAISNAFNWRNEQSQAQALQTPELLSNILEETLRSSAAAENGNVRRQMHRRPPTATDHLTRQIAELSEAQERRRAPSAIDAVAAAASGQSGWGVDISASAKQSFSEALDVQMSLQCGAGNATLSIGGVSGQKGVPLRQAGNAGLGLFQAQGAAMDGRKSRTTGGGRSNRSGANMRSAGNALYRDFSDLEMLKRLSSAKSKREQKADARCNGSLGINGSTAAGLASGSQGSYSHLSGEVGGKHAKDESSVVIAHGGATNVSGKKSRRASAADGREKRQKVVSGGAV